MLYIKAQIKNLAKIAVEKMEEEMKSQSGKAKKTAAINFIISNLPVAAWFKPIIELFLSHFIDDAVEFAVAYMKTKQKYKQEG
ncbi:hypothetical protein IJF81_00980 [bacterium]|nr:hypothetical protein [bacterium]